MSGWVAAGVFLFGTGIGALVTRIRYLSSIGRLRADVDQIRSGTSILMDTPTPDSGIRALLISADEPTAELVTRSLRQFATSTQVCTDYPTALRLLNSRKYEAVIVDCGMSRAGELLDRVRLSPSNRTTVAFAIIEGPEQQRTAFRAGSNFVFQKPLSPESISRTIKSAYALIIRERRRYFRCPVSIPARVTREGGQFDCQAINISQGGIAVNTTVQMRPGSRVSVQFALPEGAGHIGTDAEACWSDGKGRTGLRFIDLPSASFTLLEQWLAAKLEASLPDSVTAQFSESGWPK